MNDLLHNLQYLSPEAAARTAETRAGLQSTEATVPEIELTIEQLELLAECRRVSGQLNLDRNDLLDNLALVA